MAKTTSSDQLAKTAEEEPEILFNPDQINVKSPICNSEKILRQIPKPGYIKDVGPSNELGTYPLICVSAANLPQIVRSQIRAPAGGQRSSPEASSCVSAVNEEKLDSKVPDNLVL